MTVLFDNLCCCVHNVQGDSMLNEMIYREFVEATIRISLAIAEDDAILADVVEEVVKTMSAIKI
jgi:hypothetical protein